MKISQYKEICVNDRTFFIGSEFQKKLDRNLNNQLKQKYKQENKNRNFIISSIIDILNCGKSNHKIPQLPKHYSYTIIKTDIKRFFESINSHKLYKRLLRSNLLTFDSNKKIKNVVFSPKINGLPQGVSFSSSLSEIYLEDIDFDLKILFPEILGYFRFVDDILIILDGDHSKYEQKYISMLVDLFKTLDLKLNLEKTQMILLNKINEFEFNYLGYNFSSQSNNSNLNIKVAEKKVIKYLDHMDKLFQEYYLRNRNNSATFNFYILYYSLRNLLWQTHSKNFKKDTEITFGFKYTYKNINDFSSYTSINRHLKYLINRHKKYLSKKQVRTLYTLLLNENQNQIFNYNKATLNKLQEMCNNLHIVVDNDPLTQKNLTYEIFKEIYNKKYLN